MPETALRGGITHYTDMNINTNKWTYEDTDFDLMVITRELNFDYTRLNKVRYKRMMRLLRNANRDCRFRYGMSPNGYAYSCGCSHDCCGCISSSGYAIEFVKDSKRIRLTYYQSYNY